MIYRGYDVENKKDGHGNMSWCVSKDNKVQCWQNSEEAAMNWIDLTERAKSPTNQS